ncbi:alkene reductase [Sphingomonas astaxanthinifaciens]|uniref:Alkene reductase n=1 Tax=Sphingomonas astaxanthinifaciens DSM 22298 TaxID=1123267 RepID=A0ABQ5Z5R0_9SPHN|nr:alkene reductase [Sphingomonas astaxanthinifaciens]GLR46711.1 alkene reductase [Sphingomonas astaxanthinifaciens DSM 22298]
MTKLFDPVTFGDIQLANRIVMAPLTRGRSGPRGIPTATVKEYYRQRAAAGLIISEGTGISREGLGWPNAPGLWTEEQVEGWKPVTEAVHEAGGKIIAQLWHMGRLVHSSVTGLQPVSASATTAPHKAHTYDGKKPYEEARALTADDIARIMGDYATATRNALRAGFDGVQLHGANGYLVDQFLRDGTNLRDDDYGGSIENRLRFLREATEALISEAGAGRTLVRLSPLGLVQGCDDSEPHQLFVAAGKMLGELGIAALELREPGPQSTFAASDADPVSPDIRPFFKGGIILNSDYDGPSAEARLAEGVADAISFGRPFIANPDLVDRLRYGLPLATPDVATFYTAGPEGYTDYPKAREQAAA